jgi:hypothetical protein
VGKEKPRVQGVEWGRGGQVRRGRWCLSQRYSGVISWGKGGE